MDFFSKIAKVLSQLWEWIAREENRKIIAFIAAGISGAIGITWKVISHVRERKRQSSLAISFGNIAVPEVPHGGRSVHESPLNNPFSLKCVKYFEFGNVDPVLDVTIINCSNDPVLVTSVGAEVVCVAQRWLVGAILEAFTVRVKERVVVTMPDIWKELKTRGQWTKLAETKGSTSLSEFADIRDIDPQSIGKCVWSQLRDPEYLGVNAPYRYTLSLSKYRKRMPDHAILKLLVDTNRGKVSSAPIYLFVAAHIMHVTTKEEAEDSDEVDILINKANEYYKKGKYTEAEPLLKRALNIQEKILGAENLEVATLSHNLGVLYYYKGKYGEAEPLYKRALQVMEKHLGAEHPEVVKCQNDLELLYEARRRGSKAKPIIKSESGEPMVHQSFLDELMRLEGAGKYDKAIDLAKELLKAAEDYYGSDNELAANLLNRVGALYYKKEYYKEASQFFERSLKIREHCFGNNHIDVANSLNNLASALREQRIYPKSETLYKRSISILEHLGEHKQLAEVLMYYAILLHQTNRHSEAQQIMMQAERIRSEKK